MVRTTLRNGLRGIEFIWCYRRAINIVPLGDKDNGNRNSTERPQRGD